MNLIASFLGGGIVVAVINTIYLFYSDWRTRKKKYIMEQIINLYMPLYYLVLQNDTIFKLHTNIFKASEELRTHPIDNTIDICNKYVDEVIKNNDKIMELLNSKSSYIDITDKEYFATFYKDYIRQKTEYDNFKLKLDWQVYDKVGYVSFMRPEFIKRIYEQLENKKNSYLNFWK
ncbi:MAG TPA: hypothetical protein DCX95_06820 [Elusimicrobia bacterium]|nr:hypothetical protein [Elusimicrobiota bacterium]